MKNYRPAFIAALAASVVLAAALGFTWWRMNRAGSSPAEAKPAALSAPANAAVPQQPTPAVFAEAKLVPIQLSPESMRSIGLKIGEVQRKLVNDEIRTTGNVAVDETRLAYVQVRFSGYVQKVFADATYQYVRKGQPLLSIYSPDLVATEQEYLIAKRNNTDMVQSTVPGVGSSAASLLDSAVARLKQWGVPQQEIARLESTGQVQQEIEIVSPVSGYITERNALPGVAVQPEMRLYTIADLSTVWVQAQVFQDDLGRIKIGNPAALILNALPGRTISGRVDFIYPQVDLDTRTARVRVVFSNPGTQLKPGMFVNVVLKTPLGRQLVIPATGILQSGTRQIAFVLRSDGYLDPREVQLGTRVGDDFIVLNGLKLGERIVTSANFLIDSESQLKAAMGAFVPPPPGAGAAAAVNGTAKPTEVRAEFSTDPATARKGSNLYRVKLFAADGSPLSGAQVSVRSYLAGMPDMGMAAVNVLTSLPEKGGGLYEGKAELPSGGTWQITITAQKNGTVIATKQLRMNAEGGM